MIREGKRRSYSIAGGKLIVAFQLSSSLIELCEKADLTLPLWLQASPWLTSSTLLRRIVCDAGICLVVPAAGAVVGSCERLPNSQKLPK